MKAKRDTRIDYKKKLAMSIQEAAEYEYFRSEEFKKAFQKQVKADTWGKGLPMIYANSKGQIVKHFKNGKIEIITQGKAVQAKIMERETEKLRKKLLGWHYRIMKTINIIDLLESDYQSFRMLVCRRLGKRVDFRDAIKLAISEELEQLDQIRTEKRLGI